ncbi:LysR family transcriptional regulator [Lactococcus nasutitermitis]|nr:LysR family transcriptional regulator [Lactococcus nasutitermitis]
MVGVMNLRGVSVDSLQNFIAVADNGSISRAAEKLYVDQSSISRRIRALENDLDSQLFERSSRGVVLTASGEMLYIFAENFLTDLSKLTENLTSKKELAGLKIGTYDSVASTIYSDFFVREMSHLQEVFVVNDTAKLTEAFNERLDALIADHELAEQLSGNMLELSLFDEDFCMVYARAYHDFTENTVLSALDLQDFELLLHLTTCPIHQKISQAYRELAEPLPKIHEVESATSNVAFVENSEMVTILPRSVAESFVARNEKLSLVPLESRFDRHISLFARSQEIIERLNVAGLEKLK